MMLRLTGLAMLVSTSIVPSGAAASATEDFLPGDYVAGAWLVYRETFVDNDGRVVDNRNGGISHSEGQGYGLLMSVAADEQRDFERIWSWTQANLYIREDRLAAWKWDPASSPNVVDRNNATDGDLLIAWALSKAAAKWGMLDYQEEASRIVDAIVEHAVVDSAYGKLLMPGSAGFSADERKDGPVVNLSYWIFPAIFDLGKTYRNFPADELIRTGLALLRASRFGDARLPPDWLSLGAAGLKPAEGYLPTFGYDAVRIPLYLAWFSRDHPDVLEEFQGIWQDQAGLFVIELESASRLTPMRDPGYSAIAALVSCSLGSADHADRITDFKTTDYYPSTLHILSLVALSERYPECLPNLQ